MVRLTQILRWSDYFHMPKRYIERVKFNGTVIGNFLSDLIEEKKGGFSACPRNALGSECHIVAFLLDLSSKM